ncbi:NAD-dependent epimerase/dehydratase family protein [Dubosiella newyorkensis]|uniref:NAD-dependent epimerase/dehydratase family protein n=1 Tax=Dubosiella newyorkensis TaxID=1862672 RepID=UPI00248BA6D3|nr:NAD(P)-dependent oxidoreductase [Dubosiella newyorkensis]
MNYIIFGGSGFIGTHLIHLLKEEYIKPNDKIYDLDLVMPGEEGVVPGIVEHNDGVQYMRMDVRKLIHFDIPTTPDDIVFNLAAVHRTPGHEDNEYFETNIRGAEDVTQWCEEKGIKRILFTSSIAPYGASEEIKYETTLPTPNTPYGISKLVAEKIHEKWAAKEDDRQLIICRPGIVYGKGEHGNMTRLYAGLKGHYFVYTGRKDTIKACIYVKELVHFMMWALNTGKNGIYNCTFEPAFTIEQIVEAMKSATGLKTFVPLIPGGLLMGVARVVGPLGGKVVGIHPARVKKLMVSTNIDGEKMRDSGYQWHYTLEETYKDWFEDCERKELV